MFYSLTFYNKKECLFFLREKKTSTVLGIFLLFSLVGCTTLETDRSWKPADKKIQTEQQAAQVKRFLYNEQLKIKAKSDRNKKKEEISELIKNINSCEGADFALKDLVLEELLISNQDARTLASTLSIMGYTVINPDNTTPPTTNYGAPPPTQGFGAPPPTQGFGAPPPIQGFGAPPPIHGFGAPPPTQGFGAPPPTQGFGMVSSSSHIDTSPKKDGRFRCDQLPVLIMPPSVDDNQMTFSESGGNTSSGGYGGGSGSTGATGNRIINPLRRSNSVDIDRLLVFYHPEQSQTKDRLYKLVREKIDAPATQVFIETMVIEVSREDSRDLGVQWQTANLGKHTLLTFGQLAPELSDTVDFERNTLRDENGVYSFNSGAGVQVKLRALIESGRAQVLSRPSVLALSNRQAVIQILDVLQSPRVSSRINENGSLTISDYSFDPLLIGITLNLRPRVSSDRQWVSMEIDATVEAEVDENSGEVFAPDPTGGRVLLATKEGAASRKVRTFARIPDRTPIIIGGLAAANRENIKGRVPGVGELPFVGGLFGSTDNEVQERELIIVLTPYVLAEDAISIRTNSADKNHLITNEK